MPEETSPHLLLAAQDQRLGAEQDQLPRGSTGTSSVNCQETETFMLRACRTPRQPLQNNLGGLTTPQSAEEMLMDNIKEWTSLLMPGPLIRAFR